MKLPIKKTHAYRIHAYGDSSALSWDEVDLPAPGRGQALIRHTAVGMNFVDIYQRMGLYKLPQLPSGLGVEGAGVIEALGCSVTGLKPGDRVAYSGGAPPGAYAEARVLGAGGLIKLPSWMDEKIAVAAMSKGMTVEYLFNRTHKLRKGETILFHAVAGGVGLIACQWARSVGATVIGTVSTEEKARLAKRHGCRHVLIHGRDDIVAEVMRITKGRGVDVAYDSVGKDTWAASLDSVKRLGLAVSFGSASGNPPPFDLVGKGLEKSIFVTRATSVNYMTDDTIRHASARALFRRIKSGEVKIHIGRTYALKDLPQAHRDAEARRTVGSTVLVP